MEVLSTRPLRRRRRRRAWKPLFPPIGLPLRADRSSTVRRVHQEQDGSHRHLHLTRRSLPQPLLEGSLRTRGDSLGVQGSELSRFKLLSVDDLSPTEAAAAADSDEKLIGEGSTITHEYGSDDYDPFLEDGFGNLTQWRLSDLSKAFGKHLEDKMNEPKIKEKKESKEEKLKWHNDRMEQYMKTCLDKYNNEENLDKDLHFEFVKGLKESLIVEGCCKMYRHFNFEAMQPGSSVSLFFAELILNGEGGEVTCCKVLGDNDNEKCLGCTNQGNPELKHPACDNIYVGGHVNSMFPFLTDSDSEDEDSD